ncbi:hypothetical protein JMJ35_001715 [Cladonia borealis]|uniref:Pheromone alpha factor receptor n=1 Tax=Cladonia borealis TaxID=184061 RepID=A0AA39UDN3_9LECA|nr:hypothetical protein JMJ35_001715 [Cladonia borealis]
MASSTELNPFQQSFILYEADGTPFNVTIPELDAFVFYNDQICITYGAEIGASIVLFIVLLLLTKRDKRTSVIFIINALALLLNIIRMVCASIYFTGPFIETYAYFSQDFSQVHAKDKAVSVVSATLTALMLLFVETSLCLQARVVCITLRPIYRNAIFLISILIALVAVGFRFALCIENNILIVQEAAEESLNWLANATDIATTTSICCFCAVFVTKLGFALYQRKKLGLVQFGPMQILFIMGCQTLVIPAIFGILEFCVSSPNISSNVLTSTAIFLPLSSLWASASLDSRFADSKAQNFSRKMITSYATGSSAPIANHETMKGPLSPANTDNTRASSHSSNVHSGHQQLALEDLEAQGLAGTGAFLEKK